MSGHSGFQPIGSNLPAANLPQTGAVDGAANHPVNAPGAQPPEPQADAPADAPKARSLAQKLDAMLLKAAKLSARTIDADSLKTVTQTPGLGKAERRALSAAADKARETMKAISGLTGRQIASALAADEHGVFDWKNNAEAQAIRAAIDAQAKLSELLHDLANRPGITGDAFETISELALKCDRRQSEIATLSMQLADAAANADADPAVAARLDARLSALLPRQALSMHGNAEALEKLKAQLQPLADRAESFRTNPNASLSNADFMQYAVEVKDAAKALRRAAKNGFPAPDGSRVMPDRDFLNSLATLARSAEKQLEDTRKNIGGTLLKQFAARNIGVPEDLTIVAPQNLNIIDQLAPTLAKAVKIRQELRQAALDYAANPSSQESLQKINELLDRYAQLNSVIITRDIEELRYENGDAMADGDWQSLKALFEPKTDSLRTQLAHFVHMVKSVREDMTPEQFLSTTSARALLEGKLTFSTLVEARVHGMSDADVDPMLDDSRFVSSKTLGAGKVNTVKLVTYTDGEERVFKAEAPGRQAMENLILSKDYSIHQQVAQLNLATQSTANVLGLTDVCPKCSVGVHDGEYGLFMEKAPGIEVHSFVGGKKAPEGSLSAKDIRKLPPEQHARVIGGLMRGINRLEWLDLITGQGDRHQHNYMIDVRQDLSVSIKGIDNDQCFPAYRTGLRTYVLKGKHAKCFQEACEDIIATYPGKLRDQVRERLANDPGVKRDQNGAITIDTSKFLAGELHYAARSAIGMHGAALPNFIDEELYAQLTALKSGEKREAYLADLARRLPPAAVNSARNRLDEAIAHAEKLVQEGKVVSKADFEKREVQKRLLKPELEAGNPVKPVGNYQLPSNNLIVDRAKKQIKSFFMRDMFGIVTQKNWFD